jgi:hypothetical protein
MGDSGITLYLSVVAFLAMAGSIVAFVIAWRVRRRIVRVTVGVILLAVAATCGILSILAALLVAALGVAALVLASKTPQSAPPQPHGKTGQ